MINNEESTNYCAECKGHCCMHYPGIYSPNDFKDIKKELTALLQTGKYSFDSWEGDPRDGETEFEESEVLFFRPATINCDCKYIDRSWGGRCVFLNDDTGCAAPLKPHQCEDLKPAKNFPRECIGGYSKQQAATDWIPYQGIINDILEYSYS